MASAVSTTMTVELRNAIADADFLPFFSFLNFFYFFSKPPFFLLHLLFCFICFFSVFSTKKKGELVLTCG
jgi:hypothetical protein